MHQYSILLHIIDICFLTCICSVADITNPELFACGIRTWISLDIARFYEEHCQPSSGSALPACRLAPKTVIGPPLLKAGGVDTICTEFPRPLCRLCRLEPFHMVASYILDQHSQTTIHVECSIETCHRMHTRHKHTTSENISFRVELYPWKI